jgi:fluoroquinolone transport system permease protein
MTRFLSTLRWDMVLQFRYGFYFVSGFVILVWAALLTQLPADSRLDLIIPAFLVANLNITTFYFMGALVLLEKGEGTLTSLVVTPLRDGEYLGAKVASLTVLAVAENLLVIILIYGLGFKILLLLSGMIFLCGIYVLFGFIAIARYDTINEYLLPSIAFVTALMLPAIDQVNLWENAVFYIHPVFPPLILMRSAFTSIGLGDTIYGLLGSLFWVGLSFIWAKRTFHQFITRTAGT